MTTKNNIIYGHLTGYTEFINTNINKSLNYGIYKVGLTTRTTKKRYTEHSKHHKIEKEIFEKNVCECSSVETYLLFGLNINYLYTTINTDYINYIASNIILHRKDIGSEYYECYEDDLLKYLNFFTDDIFINNVITKMDIDNYKCPIETCSSSFKSSAQLTKHIHEKHISFDIKKIKDIRPHLLLKDIEKYFENDMGNELFELSDMFFSIKTTFNFNLKINEYNLNPIIINNRKIISDNFTKLKLYQSQSTIKNIDLNNQILLIDNSIKKLYNDNNLLYSHIINKNIYLNNLLITQKNNIDTFNISNFNNLLYLNYHNNIYYNKYQIDKYNIYINNISSEINNNIDFFNNYISEATIEYNNGISITINNSNKYKLLLKSYNLYSTASNLLNLINNYINNKEFNIINYIELNNSLMNDAKIEITNPSYKPSYKPSFKGGKKKLKK